MAGSSKELLRSQATFASLRGDRFRIIAERSRDENQFICPVADFFACSVRKPRPKKCGHRTTGFVRSAAGAASAGGKEPGCGQAGSNRQGTGRAEASTR